MSSFIARMQVRYSVWKNISARNIEKFAKKLSFEPHILLLLIE
ncbi:MAG: hypothetical protein M2R45_03911 [Verrucomicrobia subdivision 3 bacterium]|nr:hypothetical protein [Limisphaerales bacterium]MCS1417508.1 hypothetical protein [Limisphaerales bacterium]